MKKFHIQSLAFAVVAAAACSFTFAQAKIQEQPVGSAGGTDTSLFVSPHGVHVALLVPKGSSVEMSYDGVEGPKLDSIVPLKHKDAPGEGYPEITFSQDGSRYAYVGQMGDDYVLMVDGKEMGRSKTRPDYLAFSPGGKHVCTSTNGVISVDNHAGPASLNIPLPVFSVDDSHYLYPAANMATREPGVCLDGQVASYSGHDFTFTGDNHVLGVASDKSGDSLLQDGKAILSAPGATLSIVVAPAGPRYAVIESRDNTTTVFVDGKPIPNVDPTHDEVMFSADGKHVAIICGYHSMTNSKTWMIVDGNPQITYQATQDISFNPVSDKFIYSAFKNNKLFLVVDGQEWDGVSKIDHFTVDGTGQHFAFQTQSTVVVDNKPDTRPLGPGSAALLFSPDGSHCAFIHDGMRRLVSLDGADIPGVAFDPFEKLSGFPMKNDYLLFSPDSKHLVVSAGSKGIKGKAIQGFAFDGQMVAATGMVSHPTFTPDSQHFIWTSNDPQAPAGKRLAVFIDGKPVYSFERSVCEISPGAWEMQRDGSLILAALVDGTYKRVTIPPSADTNLASLLADAKTAEAAEATAAAAAAAETPAKPKSKPKASSKPPKHKATE